MKNKKIRYFIVFSLLVLLSPFASFSQEEDISTISLEEISRRMENPLSKFHHYAQGLWNGVEYSDTDITGYQKPI